MSKFRVKVDLSNFYNDNRQFAYVSINPQWSVVKSLQEHIKNLFDLPNVEFMTEDCCYLHPLEDIGIITKRDVLKVSECANENKLNGTKSQQSTSKKNKKSKVKADNPKEEKSEHSIKQHADNNEPPTKKLKDSSTDNVSSAGQTTATANDDNVITDVKLSVKKLKKLFDNKYKEANFSLEHDQSLTDNQLHFLPNISKGKTKRKRTRKKKTRKEIERLPIDFITAAPEPPKPTLESIKSIGHIRFDDDGNTVLDKKDETPKDPLVFKNHLDDLNKLKPRIVTATIISNASQIIVQNNGVESIPETNHFLGKGINSRSLELSSRINHGTEEEIDIVEVPEQHESNGHETCSTIQSVKARTFKCADVLKFAEPLEGAPVEGDILLFKIHRLNKNYEPTLSNYICGKFEGVEESTSFLKIFIIDGQDQLQDPEGKFSIGLRSESSDYLFLKYEDLIDKKIFKM